MTVTKTSMPVYVKPHRVDGLKHLKIDHILSGNSHHTGLNKGTESDMLIRKMLTTDTVDK